MEIYIKSIVSISPQDTFLKPMPMQLVVYDKMLQSQLPNFQDYFDPIEMRRMNKVLRSGNTCAIEALKHAGIAHPDAIIIGTGVGSVMDTERFLNNMLDNDETLLTPTAFINSTHNTLSAQIAISTACQGYNMVFVHKTISFELALADAILTIEEGEAQSVLVGGVDELTEENYNLKDHINLWKKMPCTNLDVLNSNTPGAIPGEGFAFAMLDTNKEKALAKLTDVTSYYAPKNTDDVDKFLSNLLAKNAWSASDVDIIFTGINGNAENDKAYYNFANSNFGNATHALYKNFCGEYDTASSIALWLAVQIFIEGKVPNYLLVDDKKRKPQKIIIYNQDHFKNHSFILIENCHG